MKPCKIIERSRYLIFFGTFGLYLLRLKELLLCAIFSLFIPTSTDTPATDDSPLF